MQLVKVTIKWMCIKLKKEEKLFGTLEKVSVTGDRGDCLIQVRGRFAVHKGTEIWDFNHLIEV